ncbi:MAG TPA: gluconate 2-dehydrogenase subunit 3 family protein [Bryobacteraceae bacterium]|nr:gluconate 2-dehydrogenase subunit 3 family protein [Bryobacteraceae bacterium]
MSTSIRRRRFVKTLAAAPAGSALLAQQPAPAPGVQAQPAPGVPLNPAQPVQPPPRPAGELPKIEITLPDAAADPAPRFFAAAQFAALQKLSGMLMPSGGSTPGALEAKAPEFLDFLIGRSPVERQQLYKAGLDALNAQANRRFKKAFPDLEPAQADEVLAPLRAPWTPEPPTDPLARFLQAAKRDVRTATVNSREYSTASVGGAGRRGGGGGTGLYWYPLD